MADQAKRLTSTTNANDRGPKQDRREPVLKLIEQHAHLLHQANEPGIGDKETDRRAAAAARVFERLVTTKPRTLRAAADLAMHVAKTEERFEESEATQALRTIAVFLNRKGWEGGNA